jgi:hypothetical protein
MASDHGSWRDEYQARSNESNTTSHRERSKQTRNANLKVNREVVKRRTKKIELRTRFSMSSLFCGQVSDVVLDACITGDESSHVACETCCKTDMVMIFAYKQVIRDAIKDIGYDDPTKGFELQDAQRHCGHCGAEPVKTYKYGCETLS